MLLTKLRLQNQGKSVSTTATYTKRYLAYNIIPAKDTKISQDCDLVQRIVTTS